VCHQASDSSLTVYGKGSFHRVVLHLFACQALDIVVHVIVVVLTERLVSLTFYFDDSAWLTSNLPSPIIAAAMLASILF
jgi:hypothetical protein